MERRSLLKFSAIGALFSSVVEWVKGDSLPRFEGVHIPVALPPGGGLDQLNAAFAQPGAAFQKWKAGFNLHWTGWKAGQDTTLVVAQWTAYPTWEEQRKPHLKREELRGFYSSVPGGAGPYYRGETFDISHKEGQEHGYCENFLPSIFGDAAVIKRAAAAKLDAYARLLKVMREHGHKD